MRIGSLCLVAPIDEITRCPVWLSEDLEADDGEIIDVFPGTLCIVVEFGELPAAGNLGSEAWVRALFDRGLGWIPRMDLEEVPDDL